SRQSALTNLASPPLLRIVSARASPRSMFRPRTATEAPAAARPAAIAPPRAPEPPTTTATSLLRSKRLPDSIISILDESDPVQSKNQKRQGFPPASLMKFSIERALLTLRRFFSLSARPLRARFSLRAFGAFFFALRTLSTF